MPIETVGKRQKSGINQGCGYDERPGLSRNSWRKLESRSSSKRLRGSARLRRRGEGMALEIDEISRLIAVLFTRIAGTKEMIEIRLQAAWRATSRSKCGRRCPRLSVLAMHHGHRVPANQALMRALEIAVARVGQLVRAWNRVDLRSGQFAPGRDAGAAGAIAFRAASSSAPCSRHLRHENHIVQKRRKKPNALDPQNATRDFFVQLGRVGTSICVSISWQSAFVSNLIRGKPRAACRLK